MRTHDYSTKCFEALLTYAIDEVSEENNFSILTDIGFDEKIFYKENVYHQRPSKEAQIIKALRKSQKPIRIIGHPGTGKTTLLNKVFCKLKEDENDNAYILYIDFKNIGEINRDEHASYQKMDDFIKAKLIGKVESFLHDKEITNSEIAEYILNDKEYLKSDSLNNPSFMNIVSQFRTRWDLETRKEKEFLEWFNEKRTSDNNSFNNLLFDLSKTIEIHNVLYYLSKNGKDGKDRLCIVCFDNVDSIIDNEVRNTFIEFFRNFSSNDKLSSKYLYSIRSENYKIKQLSDAKTYLIEPISVDYDDFVDEKEYEKQIDIRVKEFGHCTPQMMLEIRAKLVRNGRAKFAKSILNLRLEYLNRIAKKDTKELIEKENAVSTFNIPNFDQIIRICHLLHDDEYLRLAFIDLCNNDRREMLVNMNNFIKHLFEDIKLDLKHLEAFKDETEFILESYFYGWIASEGQFYDHDVYNIPKTIIDWYENRSDTHIQCVKDHQIFSTLYNLCNYSLHKYSYENHAKVGDLLTRLEEIGYDKNLIRQRIFDLYREPGVEDTRGLIEISRWFQITKPSDIADSDDISLTPRSFYLTSFANLKFINVIARLRSCKVRVNGKLFSYNDKIPISPITMKANLHFLARLCTMTLNGIIDVKGFLSDKKSNWFEYYRKVYCVKTNNSKYWGDNNGDLLVINMFISHLKFLRRQRKIDNEIKVHDITEDIISQYENIQKSFLSKLKKCIEDSEEIKDHDFAQEIDYSVFNIENRENTGHNNM